jgi:hypothetical protein
MKSKFILIILPVLLITLAVGQTPAQTNTDQATIKGCLGGTDGNYTIAEDGTTQTFKITTSTVDLKPHLGHDVAVTGQKVTVGTDSGSSDNNVAVTGLNMISDHCATPTASTPAATDTTPATTASTPVATDTTPAATASTPAATDTTPATTASTPAATDTTAAATTSTPVATDTTATASATVPENTHPMPDTATSLPLLGLLGLSLLTMGLLTAGLLNRRARTS